MHSFPKNIEISDCCIATDGGSIVLFCTDDENNKIVISLNKSISDIGSPTHERICVNGILVEKYSSFSDELKTALINAKVSTVSASTEIKPKPIGRLIIGEDLQQVFQSLDQGPDAFTKDMVATILKHL